jgi:hypothetical protein
MRFFKMQQKKKKKKEKTLKKSGMQTAATIWNPN